MVDVFYSSLRILTVQQKPAKEAVDLLGKIEIEILSKFTVAESKF